MEDEELLFAALKHDLQIDLPPRISFTQLRDELSAYISTLIHDHFDELIYLLYKVDVSESKLKSLLQENTDTASLIADLIIERQLQKIRTRKEFKSTKGESSDEEKW